MKNRPVNRMVIKTNHKDQKRGSYYPNTGLFRRDNTPLVRNAICLEPDVLQRLMQLSCKDMLFILREGREVRLSIQDYMKSPIRTMGETGDKRPQYVYRVPKQEVVLKAKIEQESLFI